MRQGKARQDETRKGKARQDKTRQGKMRQGKARQDKTRKGKTRQRKARQDKNLAFNAESSGIVNYSFSNPCDCFRFVGGINYVGIIT